MESITVVYPEGREDDKGSTPKMHMCDVQYIPSVNTMSLQVHYAESYDVFNYDGTKSSIEPFSI